MKVLGIAIVVVLGVVTTAQAQDCSASWMVDCCMTSTTLCCCMPGMQEKEPVSVLASPAPEVAPQIAGETTVPLGPTASTGVPQQRQNTLGRRRAGFLGRFFGRIR